VLLTHSLFNEENFVFVALKKARASVTALGAPFLLGSRRFSTS